MILYLFFKKVETSLLEEEKPREMSSTSSVNSTYEKLTQKPSAEGRSLTGKILGNEPPSATQRNSFTKTQGLLVQVKVILICF